MWCWIKKYLFLLKYSNVNMIVWESKNQPTNSIKHLIRWYFKTILDSSLWDSYLYTIQRLANSTPSKSKIWDRDQNGSAQPKPLLNSCNIFIRQNKPSKTQLTCQKKGNLPNLKLLVQYWGENTNINITCLELEPSCFLLFVVKY